MRVCACARVMCVYARYLRVHIYMSMFMRVRGSKSQF